MAIFKKEKDVDEKEKDLNNFLPFPVYPHKYCSLWTNHPLVHFLFICHNSFVWKNPK